MIKRLFNWYLGVSLVVRILAAFVLGSLLGGLFWFLSSQTGSTLLNDLIPYIAPFGTVLINMLNQQVNILSTHIHNLTLTQQGEMAKMPQAEELTEAAVNAEEMLERLKGDSEMAGSLDTGLADMATSDEELAILAEFEAPAADSAATRQATAPREQAPAEPEPPARQRDEPEAL